VNAPTAGSPPWQEAVKEPAGRRARVHQRVDVVLVGGHRVPAAVAEQGHNAPVRHPGRVRGGRGAAAREVGREERAERSRDAQGRANLGEPARHVVARRRPEGAERGEHWLGGWGARRGEPGETVAEEVERQVRLAWRRRDGIGQTVGPPAPFRVLVAHHLEVDAAVGPQREVRQRQPQELRRAAKEKEGRRDGSHLGARHGAGGVGRRLGDSPGGRGGELGAFGRQDADSAEPAPGEARAHGRQEGPRRRPDEANRRVPGVDGGDVRLQARRALSGAREEGGEVGGNRVRRGGERRPPGRRAQDGKLPPVLLILGGGVRRQRRHVQVGSDARSGVPAKAVHDVGVHKRVPAAGGHALPPRKNRSATVRQAGLGAGVRPRPRV